MSSRKRLDGAVGSLTVTQATVEPVVVDVEACRRLAKLLSAHSIPASHEDSSLPGFAPRQIGNFYLLLVAICHQTSPRGRPPLEGVVGERRLRGWDYLSAKLEAAARINPEILSPDSWGRVTPEDLRELFRDEKLGDRLGDPAGRSLLVRDLGQKMQQHSWKWADEIYHAAEGRIATGDRNLIDLLAEFRAYEDPVRKKSFFYLALMHNAGLWVYTDPEKLGAPVDYHEVRGHLRLGTVQVVDPDLRRKLLQSEEVTADQDISIRQAVYEALMLISELSGLRNPNQLHYLFWNVFRSCCPRDNPHCSSCPSNCSLPERYVPLALFPSGPRRCPFSEVCQSAGREPKLLEHSLDTDYY